MFVVRPERVARDVRSLILPLLLMSADEWFHFVIAARPSGTEFCAQTQLDNSLWLNKTG